MKNLKRTASVTITISVIFGMLFVFGSVLGSNEGFDRHLKIGLLGLFIGALAVPELEDKLIKHPIVYQSIVGVLLGVCAVYMLGLPVEWYFIGMVGGFLLGYLAPFWVKHIPPL